MKEDTMARMKQDFIADASDTIEKVSHSLSALDPDQTPSRSQVDWLFRTVHSLKGTSGMFDLHEVSALAASVEDLLEIVRSRPDKIDKPMLEVIVEAFDELAVLLQQGRGENLESRWEAVRDHLESLTGALSRPAAEEGPAKRDGNLARLQGDLNMMLSSEELAAIERCVERGFPILRMTFDLGTDAPTDYEEAVLRQLQRCGEIISILPPEKSGRTKGNAVLSLVYSPKHGDAEAEALFRDTVSAYDASTEDVTPNGRTAPAEGGTREVPPPPGSDRCREGSAPRVSPLAVKVDIGVLDSMLNTVSELYSVRLGLLGAAKGLPHTDATRRLRDDLLKLGLTLDNKIGLLEESIVEVRLVPVSILFERYRGEVRRLARRSDKLVDLVFEGESTRIDRAMLDNLHDPILHIIRNAVDHGIESPAERRSISKPEKGRILLRAKQESSHICIEVEDDGRGVDESVVRRKAREKGIAQAATAPPLSLIFEPGMSTRCDVTEISGRGVGLDAAKTKIDGMKGVITADTTPGKGTRFSVYVPLTLAVSRGVLVEESAVPAVVPLRSVIEVLALGRDLVKEMKQSGTVTYRGSQVKALALSEMLNVNGRQEARSAVVLGIGEKRRVLVAQRVAGETDIVSRPLPAAMVAPGFIAGAAELHDGRPAVIIQPEDLLSERPVGGSHPTGAAYRMPHLTSQDRRMDGQSVCLLIFSDGTTTYGIALELLREVIMLKSLTEVPVLGEAWEGVFFHRGMCHGLLSLPGGRRRDCDGISAAILESPERCGIGMRHLYGNSTVPVSDIVPIVGDNGSGLLRPCGNLRWNGRDVVVLTVPSGPRTEEVKSSVPAAGSTNAGVGG